MPGRIIEIQNPGLYLSLDRGFMCIYEDKVEKSKIPISDISSLIFSGPGNTVSTNLLSKLQENGCIVVLTGENYHPTNLLWPLYDHHKFHERIHLQIETSAPLKKTLWKHIVKNKIKNQAEVLKFYTKEDYGLLSMADLVKSGDIKNMEAQASRKYWKNLMGHDFKRDPNIKDINVLLNYGYSIIRASMARAISASGLHAALGIHHDNKNNPFCLVDDLIEIFRPLVDFNVRYLQDIGNLNITPTTKRFLSSILDQNLKSVNGNSPASICIRRLAQTFYNSLETGKILFELPLSIIPIGNLNIMCN